jgi:hypothetical protein
MSKNPIIRFAVYAIGIVLIAVVLLISVTRQTLYAPTAEDAQARANLRVGDRIKELQIWPPNPDHPLYILRVGADRAHIALTPAEQRPLLKLSLASARLHSAYILLTHHRTSLSLTTVTKSTKYILSAADDVLHMYPNISTPLHGKVRVAVNTQIDELTAMKESYSDEQKSVIDQLLSQLFILKTQFL